MSSVKLLQPPTTSKTKIFEDPHHTEKVSETFERFYQEQQFLDIVIVAAIDNVKVKAHRIVVSAASDYFTAMFSSTLKESNADEIELQNIDGITLLSIIEFMYSGTMTLNSETVQNVLIAADFLQMNELIKACCEFMSEHLDINDCLDIAVFAEQLNYNELSQQAYSVALNNYEELYKEKEFLDMNHEQLLKFISFKYEADCLVNEETVFLSISAWVDYDRTNREPFVFDLLSAVQYHLLTPRFIIENRHSVCTSVECYEMILSWVEWHLLPDTQQSLQAPSSTSSFKKKNIVIMIPGGRTTEELKAQMFRSQLNWWSELEIPSSPIRKEHYGVSFINEQLIIVGGRTLDCGSCYYTSSCSVESLHLGTMQWSELPPMQQSRHHCAVAEVDGNLYAIGGYSSSSLLGSVEKFDFSTGQWRFVAPLIHGMRIAEATVLNGMIYAIDVGHGLNVMQCYDPSTNEWSLRSFKQEPSRYFGIAAGCGYLYTFGGYLNEKTTNTVERYNPIDDTWSFMTPLEEPRSGAKCAFLNYRIIVCAGRDNDGLTNRVEEYNPRTNEWKTLAPLLTAMDGRSKILSY